LELFLHSIPLWFELVSLACCTGVLVFLLSPDERESTDQSRVWLLLSLFVLLAMAASVIALLQRIAEMSGEEYLPSLMSVQSVLAKTHFGRVWLVRITALACMLVISGLRRFRVTNTALVVLFCLNACAAFTESASGHAADKGDFSIAEIMDWIHLLGALVWAGGIFVFTVSFVPKGPDLDVQLINTFSRRVVWFSGIASIAFIGVALTALYNVVMYVGSVNALVKTPYGLTVAGKAALLFMLLLPAAYNRYLCVPNLVQSSGLTYTAESNSLSRLASRFFSILSMRPEAGAPIKYFRRAIRFEAILLLGLLLGAAFLRHEIPARHAIHGDNGAGSLHEHMHHE
jgi:putative copper export protein